MSTVRLKLVAELKDLGNNVMCTYGYITKSKRIKSGLVKTHGNDAFVIARGTTDTSAVDTSAVDTSAVDTSVAEERSENNYLVKQVRKQNRKLFKGIRSHIRNTAPRFVEGFQRFDKVKFKGEQCFVFGRRLSGYFDLRRLDGQIIHRSAKAKKLKLIQSFNTLLWEPMRNKAFVSSPE